MYAKIPIEPPPKPTRRSRLGCLLLIVLVVLWILGLWLLIYRTCFPYDEVEVKVHRLPEGERIFAVVINGPTTPVVLEKYSHFWWTSSRRHPDSYYSMNTNGPDGLIGQFRWVEAQRIGILAQREDRQWIIYWFNPPKNQLHGRTLLKGRGELILHLDDADEIEPITEDTMRAMGFVEVLKEREPVPRKK